MPKNMGGGEGGGGACKIMEYLSSQDCFYSPVIVPYQVGRIC